MSVHAVVSRPEPLPHPPWRIPLLGDVVGQTLGTPIQDATRSARTLGPVLERKILNKRFMFTGDPDIVAEQSDEIRFDKQLVPQHLALQGISGDGLATPPSTTIRTGTVRTICYARQSPTGVRTIDPDAGQAAATSAASRLIGARTDRRQTNDSVAQHHWCADPTYGS